MTVIIQRDTGDLEKERTIGEAITQKTKIRTVIDFSQVNAFTNTVSWPEKKKLGEKKITYKINQPIGLYHVSNFSYKHFLQKGFLDAIITVAPMVLKSDYKIENHVVLLDMFIKLYKTIEEKLHDHQSFSVFDVINELRNYKGLLDLNINLKYSADNEIYFVRKTTKGKNYIIIGEDQEDMSFGFAGNNKGDIARLSADFNIVGVKEIVDAFLNF